MSQSEPETFDPRRRRLCPDGACVGVIGADGRCRVCGADDPGGPPTGLDASAFGGGCASELDDAPDEHADVSLEAEESGGSGFDPKRPLCPDGSCLGVLSAERRCNVCGRGPEA